MMMMMLMNLQRQQGPATTKTCDTSQYTPMNTLTILDARLASREILRDWTLMHQLSDQLWTPS